MTDIVDEFFDSLDRRRTNDLSDSQRNVPMTTCEKTVDQTPETCTEETCCQQQIRDLAYQKWQEAGEPCGDGVDFWLDAETELAAQWAADLTSGNYTQE